MHRIALAAAAAAAVMTAGVAAAAVPATATVAAWDNPRRPALTVFQYQALANFHGRAHCGVVCHRHHR